MKYNKTLLIDIFKNEKREHPITDAIVFCCFWKAMGQLPPSFGQTTPAFKALFLTE